VKILLLLLILGTAHAICIHEKLLSPEQIQQLINENNEQIFINLAGKFKLATESRIKALNYRQKFLVHLSPKSFRQKSNKTEVPYYYFEDMNKYYKKIKSHLATNNYSLEKIGTSIKGKDLHVIKPNSLDPLKKTIVMLGRQHGDESTQNWIIEGFLDTVFMGKNKFLKDFQVIAFPMINPDGADAVSRYNSNDYDLNRSWHKDLDKAKDEAKIILDHLYSLNFQNLDIKVFLDMHGSFTEDFIYRVDKDFKDKNFFSAQQTFIDTLGKYDPFQNGYSETSNGAGTMSRIVMIKSFNLNAITHETPRRMKETDSYYRSVSDLKKQGEALVETISEIY
jgi:hypothetical protein